MRILMLAVTFPRPDNLQNGPWALRQAQMLRSGGAEVRVVVPHSWVPAVAARSESARRWREVPASHDFDGIQAFYERAPYYNVGRIKRWTHRHPAMFMRIAKPMLNRRLLAHVDEFKPDVIWAHHSLICGFPATWMRRARGVPYVTIDHDLDEVTDSTRLPARRRAARTIYSTAHTSIGINNQMSAMIRQIAPDAHVQTVHNGFDIALGTPPQQKNGPVIFAIGAFFDRKNMPGLVKAFAPVAPRHPTARLRIAGAGHEFELVKRLVHELNVADRVELLGPIPSSQAMNEMAGADIFALVGWNEPFATAYVEALAHGLPLVCGNDGGINDVITEGTEAFAVPPRDIDAAASALDRLLGDESLRRRMGDAARKLYQEKLTGKAWATRMLQIFEEAKAG